METNILQYLVQDSKGAYYSNLLSSNFFLDPTNKVLFDLIKDYYRAYHKSPTKEHIVRFLEKEFEKTSIDSSLQTNLKKKLNGLYVKLPEDIKFVEREIVDEIKKTMTSQLILKYSKGLAKADADYYQELYREIGKIVSIESMAQQVGSGTFFLKEFKPSRDFIKPGIPCPWPGINNMTAAKGFETPELIILLSGAKSFKTLLMIVWAVHVMRLGYDVFIADFENGKNKILTRLAQHILEATREDLMDAKYTKEFEEIRKRLKKYKSGDIRVHKFRAHQDHPGIVDQELDRLEVEENFCPKLIIWDYVDIMGCSNYYLKDPRLIIQHNYHEIISINDKRGCFSVSISKVSGNSFNKEILSIEDFGEDKAKAYNCHAAFAINIPQESREADEPILMVSPLVQREGISYRPDIVAYIQIQKETQQANEVNITVKDE